MIDSRRAFFKMGTAAILFSAFPVNKLCLAAQELPNPYHPIAEAAKDDPAFYLTKQLFDAQLGTRFYLQTEQGESVVLKLVEVADLKRRPGHTSFGKEGFSMLFSGKQQTELAQGTYKIEHAELGVFSLLIVPVESGKKGKKYEAVINRLYP